MSHAPPIFVPMLIGGQRLGALGERLGGPLGASSGATPAATPAATFDRCNPLSEAVASTAVACTPADAVAAVVAAARAFPTWAALGRAGPQRPPCGAEPRRRRAGIPR